MPETTDLQKAIGAVIKSRRARLKLSQDDVCKDIHGYHYSNLSKVENGQQTLPLDKLEQVCEVLLMTPSELYQMAENRLAGAGQEEDAVELHPKEARVPYYGTLQLLPGERPDPSSHTGKVLRFTTEFLDYAGVDPGSAFCFRYRCNNMEPKIPFDAVVGVHTRETTPIGGKIYALNHHGMVRLAKCYPLPGGGLRIASANSEEYPEESYTKEEAENSVLLLGRAFWVAMAI